MKIWGIADLHLSLQRPKPMDVFGPHWQDHQSKVERAWLDRVAAGDVVCLPGDLSWALRVDEVRGELAWLGRLPGRKILVRGNHDYWWSSLTKVRQALPAGVYALQGDALLLDGVAFAGARGWVDADLDFGALLPRDEGAVEGGAMLHGIRGPQEDRKIYRRELGRLEASLRCLSPSARLRVGLLHFPPTSPALEETAVTNLLEGYRVDEVVFGHLHGAGAESFRNPYGKRHGVRYHLVSADFANFAPVLVAEVP